MSISIRQLVPEFYDAYNAFLSAQKDAMLYYSLNYREFLTDLLKVESSYYIALNENNEVVGVLPIFIKEGVFGKVYNSLPFYGSNGAVISKDEVGRNQLIKYYNTLVADNSIAASTYITNPLTFGDINDELFTFTFKDYRIGQFTNIKFDVDHEVKLMDIYHYKTRNMIRKGMKSDLTIVIDNDAIPFLMETHKQNMYAIGGKPKRDEFFQKFPKYFKPGVDYNIYLAKLGETPVAALLLFYFNQTVEYYTPVIVEQYRDKQPLSFLIYKSMVDASKKKYELWNWGGTWASQGGVYTFKKRWGTFDLNYYYYIRLNNKEILSASKQELLQHYEDFFVLPFDKLNNK